MALYLIKTRLTKPDYILKNLGNKQSKFHSLIIYTNSPPKPHFPSKSTADDLQPNSLHFAQLQNINSDLKKMFRICR